jgi:hypothetical protein
MEKLKSLQKEDIDKIISMQEEYIEKCTYMGEVSFQICALEESIKTLKSTHQDLFLQISKMRDDEIKFLESISKNYDGVLKRNENGEFYIEPSV